MESGMSRTVLLCAILVALLPAAAPELSGVRTVYLFPMGSGLDQYLANRLTNVGIFQVVADPKKADAVFTDRLGPAFEARLAELFPEPPPPPAEPPKKAEKEKKDKEAAPPAVEVPTAPEPPRLSSFARGKGTLFIVHPKTRAVLWSVYEKPAGAQSADLDRAARRIIDRLQRDIKAK